MVHRWRLAFLCALCVSCAACDKSRSERSGSETKSAPDKAAEIIEAEPRPPRARSMQVADEWSLDPSPSGDDNIAVQLPPVPEFGVVPQLHPDGAWSIRGVRSDIETHEADAAAGAQIEVRGYVHEIYVPPACPATQVCAPADPAHLWITDEPDQPDKRRALLVVGYAFEIAASEQAKRKSRPEVRLRRGKRYTFRGRFGRYTASKFTDPRGLLEFRAVRSEGSSNWVYPPGAPWHPSAE